MPMLRFEAGMVRVPGASIEDQMQEARIGLWKAARDFEPGAGVPFRHFARLCVRRQVITMLKAATRGKHRPLSQSVRTVEDDDGALVAVTDILPAPAHEAPDLVLCRRETLSGVSAWIDGALTARERWALDMYAGGCTYEEIADALDCGTKSVDNALQRCKRKIRAYLQAEAA